MDDVISIKQPEPKDFLKNDYYNELVIKKSPFELLDFYEVSSRLLEYKDFYINFGLWDKEKENSSPGRNLTMHAASFLDIKKEDMLLDIGSGLGQAAIDIVKEYKLRKFVGLSDGDAQTDFCRALAKYNEIEDKTHFQCLKAESLARYFETAVFSHIMAIESMNHIKDFPFFLKRAGYVLNKTGSMVMTVFTRKRGLPFYKEKYFNSHFDFSLKKLSHWEKEIKDASWQIIHSEEMTERVLKVALKNMTRNLSKKKDDIRLPFAARLYIRAVLEFLKDMLRAGQLSYHLIQLKPY